MIDMIPCASAKPSVKPGDCVEFILDDTTMAASLWPPDCPMDRLSFSVGYVASGRSNIVAEVRGEWLRLTAFKNLWAPVAACRVVAPTTISAKPGEMLATQLRTIYPHGHPDFIPRLLEIARLHSDKNHDYALGGPPLGNFERTATVMQLYPQFPWATDYGCATVQMLKQLDAFLWQAQDSKFQAKVEGIDTRLRDIMVFSQLIAIMVQAGA